MTQAAEPRDAPLELECLARTGERLLDQLAGYSAAQEALAKLCVRLRQFRGEAQFSTWLYRVIVNRCLDFKRKPVNAALDLIEEQSDDRPDAYQDIATRERQAKIAGSVAELPERQRTAIALSYTAGLSNAEAAASMEISVKAFESLLVRAKRELRDKLAGDGEE